VKPKHATPTSPQVGAQSKTSKDDATIEDFAAEGYTHVECFCPRCRVIRLRQISWLPRISLRLTIAQLSERLRCADCGGPVQSVKPWRMEEVLGEPQGRRG